LGFLNSGGINLIRITTTTLPTKFVLQRPEKPEFRPFEVFSRIETRKVLGLRGIQVIFTGNHAAFVDNIVFESLILIPSVAKSDSQHYEVILAAHIACRIKKTGVAPNNCPRLGLRSLHDLEIRVFGDIEVR
jgi:hypothetical protein